MAKAKSTLPKGVRVGASAPEASGGTAFWGLKEKTQLKILVDASQIVSIDQFAMWDVNPAPIWVDSGEKDDPGRELGLKPGYRAFVPVEVEVEGEKQVRVWAIPITVHRQLDEIDDMIDGLEGAIIRGNRTGTGRTTKYTLVPTGKRESVSADEVPSPEDIVAMLGPFERDEVIAMIEERTGKSYAELLANKNGDDDGDFEVEEV